ncbi:MAG: hypothetical protein RIT25_2569, partial [Planctomycetota bacterium]
LGPAEVCELQAMVRQVLCGSHLLRFVAELLQATQPTAKETGRYVRFGASARAGQAIVLGAKVHALLAGRAAVERQDLETCLLPALRHRVLLSFEAEAEGLRVADLLPRWTAVAEKVLR